MDFLRWTIRRICDKVVVHLLQSGRRPSKRWQFGFPRVWVPVDLVVGVMGLRAATENVSALANPETDEEDMCRTKKPW
jgi:hypothetical protein